MKPTLFSGPPRASRILATGIIALLAGSALVRSGCARAQLFWDGPNTTNNGSPDGSSGNWDHTSSFWSTSGTDAAAHQAWADGNGAVFQSTVAGTKTITITGGSNVTATGLTFNTTGFLITDDGSNGSFLHMDGATTINVNANAAAAIATSIVSFSSTSSLTINGGGVLILAGVNQGAYAGNLMTVTGATTVVAIGDYALPSNAALALTYGALDVNGSNVKAASLAGAAPSIVTNSNATFGTLTVGRNAPGSSTTYAGTITDTATTVETSNNLAPAGGLGLNISSETGPYRLILTGATNTYHGGTTVGTDSASNTAVLQAGAAHAFSANSAVDVRSSGILDLHGTNQTIAALDGTGTGQVTNGSPGSTATLTLAGDGAADALITNASLNDGAGSGILALVKNGAYTQGLAGASTYSGGTIINGGVLAVVSDGALGSTSGGITLNGGALQVFGTFPTARPITLGASGGTVATSGATQLGLFGKITGNGPLNLASPIVGNAAIFLQGTVDNTYTGLTTVQTGFVGLAATGHVAISGDVQINSGAALILLTGEQIADTATVTNHGGLHFDSTSNVKETIGTLNGDGAIYNEQANLGTLAVGAGAFSGSIVDGNGTVALVKQGAGTLALTGSNSYSGGTTVNGGILAITSENSLGNVNSGITLNGGTLQANANVNLIRAVTLGSAGGGVSTLGNSQILLNGKITGNGPLNLSSPTSGGAAIFLGAAVDNDFTGLTTVQTGFIELAAAGHVAISGNLQINSGGILSINNSEQIADTATVTNNGVLEFFSSADVQETIGTLNGTGVVTNAQTTTGTLRVGAGTFSGMIANGAGPVALVKQGAGTLALSGTNSYSGGTTITGGILSVVGNAALGNTSGGITLDGGTLQATAALSTARTITLGTNGGTIGSAGAGIQIGLFGQITGSGPLNLTNVVTSGVIFFLGTADNTYTGLTTVQSGTVRLEATGHIAISGDAQVNSGAFLAIDTNEQIADTSTVTVNGSLVFNGSSNVQETIGSLQGSGSVANVKNNTGTLVVGAGNFTGNISNGNGVVALVKQGAGTLTLSGANTYTGGTTIKNGKLQLGGNNALLTSSTVTVNQPDGSNVAVFDLHGHNQTLGGLTFVAPANLAAASLVDLNGGVLTLAGNVSLVNNTQNPGSALAAGIQDTAGGGALDLGNATRSFLVASQATGAQDLVISAVIQGQGGVVLNATPSTLNGDEGGVVFTKANRYTGSTTVARGRLTTTAAGALPATTDLILGTIGSALSGDVDLSGTSQTVNSLAVAPVNSGGAGNFISSTAGGATLTVSSTSTNSSFAGFLTGPLSLVKAGAGTTLALTAANTYTGTTTVNGGTLAVDGSIAAGSAVTVNNGGTLAGTGNVQGAVTIQSGGILAPGDSGGPGSLTVGSLVLNAGAISTFRLTQAGVSGSGVNDLVTSSGTITNGGQLLILTRPGFGPGSYPLFAANGGFAGPGFSSIVGLAGYSATINADAVSASLAVSFLGTAQYWDGTGAVNNGSISGGTGTWTTAVNNWTNSTGTTNTTWQNGTAIFATPGGTVTLGAPITAQALFFNSTGYVLAGTKVLTLSGASSGINVTNAGDTATISAPLAGTAGLAAEGTGTLILTSASNTYTGGTTVTFGTLQLGTAAAATKIDSTGLVAIGYGGKVSLRNVSGNILANGVRNGLGGLGTLDINSTNLNTLSGALTDGSAGQLGLIQEGTGTTILTNAGNTFTGPTTVRTGTLQIGTASVAGTLGSASPVSVGTGGTLALLKVNGGVLANNITNSLGSLGLVKALSTTALTFNGALSDGSGTLAFIQGGTGAVTLAGNNSYTGATTVSAGTLQVGNGTSGNLTGATTVTVSGTGLFITDLASGAAFVPNVNLSAAGTSLKAIQSGTNTLSGAISGPGTFNQNGTGTTILTGTETYTGITSVNTGTLQVNGSMAAGSTVNVGTAGTLAGSGTIPGKATLTGNGAINFQGGTIGGTLAVTGGQWNGSGTVGGAITASTNAFSINGTLHAPAGLAVTGGTLGGTGVLDGSLTYTSGANSTLAATITGAGSKVIMNKAGATLILTGTDTYGGTTTVSAGTLQMGDGANGLLSGTSGITVSGTGIFAMNLPGTSSYNRPINLSAAGATLKAMQAGTTVLDSAVSGLGIFSQTGPGTTILTAVETYTGATNVNAGTLQVDGSLAAASTVNVDTAGTLAGSGRVNGKATLAGNGTINLNGGTIAGTLAVTGGQWNGSGTVGGAITASTGAFSINGTLHAPLGLAVTGGTLGGTGVLDGSLTYTSSANRTLGATISGATSKVIMNKAGATLILTGTDTYGGTTTVSAGTLQMGDGVNGLLSSTSGITVAGTGIFAMNLPGTSSYNIPINLSAAGATLKAMQAGTTTLDSAVSGSGIFSQNGPGTTILTVTETYTGATNVSAGILQINGSLAAASTVNVATAGTLTGAGVIGGKATLTGNGSINLGSSGAILGTLAATGGNWNGLGTVNGLVTATANTFQLNGSLTAPVGLTVSGGTLTGTGTLTGPLTYASPTSGSFGGIVAGVGAKLTKSGASTFTVTGGNTYGGGTNITAGTLVVGNGATTGTRLGSAAVTVASGATLKLNLATGETFANPVTDTGNFIADGAANYTVSGVVQGAGTVAKTGANIVALTAANTYKGGTTVSGGTLLANNTIGSATGTGAVTVNTGGTLGGSGLLTGAITLNSGGRIQPGAGLLGTAGTTLNASALKWNGGGTLTLQLGPTSSDALALTGALTKGTAGAYTINILDAGLTQSVYTLATFASTTFTLGNFILNLPAGDTGTLIETGTGLSLSITSVAAAGSSQQPGQKSVPVVSGEVAGGTLSFGSSSFEMTRSQPIASDPAATMTISPSFVAAPEPGTFALLALGASPLLGWRRRRRVR